MYTGMILYPQLHLIYTTCTSRLTTSTSFELSCWRVEEEEDDNVIL